MSRKNIERFTQGMIKENFVMDIEKGERAGQIVFSIDVTDESQNKRKIKKLIRTLKRNLNRKQIEDVKVNIVENNSSVLAEELINCYDKYKHAENDKSNENAGNDDEASRHSGDDSNLEICDEKENKDLEFEESKIDRQLVYKEKKQREREKEKMEKERKKICKQRRKEEKKRVKKEIKRIKSESKSRRAIFEDEMNDGGEEELSFEELKNLCKELKSKLQNIEKKEKRKKGGTIIDNIEHSSSASRSNEKDLRKTHSKPERKTSQHKVREGDNKNLDIKKRPSKESSSTNKLKSKDYRREKSPKIAKIEKEKSKREKSKEKRKTGKKKLKVNYVLFSDPEIPEPSKRTLRISKRRGPSINNVNKNNIGMIEGKSHKTNELQSTPKINKTAMKLETHTAFGFESSKLISQSKVPKTGKHEHVLTEKKYSSEKLICSVSLRTLDSRFL